VGPSREFLEEKHRIVTVGRRSYLIELLSRSGVIRMESDPW
jgi:hypothetical protein